MKRSLAALVAMLLLSGCRAPAPPNDPFLYRSTVPPPGTIAPPATGTPYYSAPAAVPGPAAPAGVAPVTPITPAPAPLAPAPGVPVAPPSKYSPPGGFNYQSSLRPPAGLTSPAAVATSNSAAAPVDSTVVAAGSWQAPKDSLRDTLAILPITQPITQPRPDPSVVRIVEPAKPTTSNPIDSAQSSVAAGSGPQSGSPTSGILLAAATMPSATPPTPSANGAAAAQMAAPLTIQSIAASSQDTAKPSSNARQDAAPSTDRPAPTSTPAEVPGATYGYDPDYKTLRGKLEYSVATRRWKLVYLAPDGPIDEYGGSVVLPDPAQLNGFEAGDFVTVQGTFTPPTSGSGAPMFAIQRIKRQ